MFRPIGILSLFYHGHGKQAGIFHYTLFWNIIQNQLRVNNISAWIFMSTCYNSHNHPFCLSEPFKNQGPNYIITRLSIRSSKFGFPLDHHFWISIYMNLFFFLLFLLCIFFKENFCHFSKGHSFVNALFVLRCIENDVVPWALSWRSIDF